MKHAVALGNFDGVHRAHGELIRKLVDYAGEKNMKSVVYTFDKHPSTLLGDLAVKTITSNDEKGKILHNMGVDEVYFEPLTAKLLNTSPEVFIKDILMRRFDVGMAAAGFNYRFGKNGEGNTNDLCALGKKYGFDVLIADEVTLDGATVSSTEVRKALLSGEIERANNLLGRTYSLFGVVVKGKELGRTIGFPTLNIELAQKMLSPKNGVYVSRTEIEGVLHEGVTNIGTNPTVENAVPRAETHVFGFDRFVYGSRIKVFLLQRIRDEKRFSGVDELKAQIAEDVKHAKKIFKNTNL